MGLSAQWRAVLAGGGMHRPGEVALEELKQHLIEREEDQMRPILKDFCRTEGNTVAIVSDGSAVLGLGNIGARAAMPVMSVGLSA